MSPSFVGDPSPTSSGVQLDVDCKAELEEAVGATFRRIVREELERAGVVDATVVTPPRWSET